MNFKFKVALRNSKSIKNGCSWAQGCANRR